MYEGNSFFVDKITCFVAKPAYSVSLFFGSAIVELYVGYLFFYAN